MQREAALGLGALQRAMLAEIRGGTVGSSSANVWIAAATPERAREQIGVYAEMYRLRLVREVAREYPATRALLGPERFEAVARAFVARTGSRSFTLEGYASSLPAFLRRTCGRAVTDWRLRTAAAALAGYERDRARVQRAPAAPTEVRLGRLLHADGARIVLFTHAVDSAYARFARREPIDSLRATRVELALFRDHRGRVTALRITPHESGLLRDLVRGARLESAVARASDAGMRPSAIRAALTRWVGAGLLSARH